MPKSEKLFDMLQLVREYPNLNARDLARLCDVSERGIYRYLNTLSRAGIAIRFQNGGYKLQQDDYTQIFGKAEPEDLETLGTLLSEGMRACEDDDLVERGKKLMELMGMALPARGKKRPNYIEIVSEGTEAAQHGGTITIGHSSVPSIINPILTSETVSVNLMCLIFNSLVKFDSAQRPVPDLAKSWKVSKDGLVWTFSLRDDVKFHDGHPLTAHDVEFTYKAIMDSKNKSPLAKRYELIDRIEVEDDYTLRMTLKYPFAPFIHWLNREIAPKHLLEGEDIHNTSFNKHPVGSGPFRLTDWTKDHTIILDANREYFRKDRPVLDSLIFKAYQGREDALRAITHGDMDITLDLTASDLLFVGKRRTFRIYSAMGASYYAIVLNLKDPLFRDVRVRMALDYAIDRDSIIKNQLKGHSRICTGPFNINSWAYNPYIQSTPYNVETAKKLLGQAGWHDTDDDGVLDKDGKPLEISLAVPNIADNLERVAVAIRAQLMKTGIKVKLDYMDDSELYKKPFQAVLSMIITGADPDYVYRSWHSEGGNTNLSSYENRYVDDLLELGRQTTDFEKRKAIYHKIHEMIHDDCPAIFLASGREFIGSNYRFRDAGFSSLEYFLTTMRDWQIVSDEREDTVHKYNRKVESS